MNSGVDETYNKVCVYDGNVWADFLSKDGQPAPFNYALHLNIDWFQPFKHTQHSEGAIYLSVLNLPAFLKENVFLVGIIPGLKEHMISFLLTTLANYGKVFA